MRPIDFPGRPARLESLWPISPPCLFALRTAEVVIKMNKGFQAELSAELAVVVVVVVKAVVVVSDTSHKGELGVVFYLHSSSVYYNLLFYSVM